jgi:2-C-methyl-D-erythritol 4-phosphate cytidylyltransferase
VVLVVPPGRTTDGDHGADLVVEGGATRTQSVRRGLAAVPQTAEVIVVHDAARPLAPDALFREVIAAVTSGGAGGAIPGLRDTLVAVQTPQAFAADLLRRAHAAGTEATDDAALVEALGATVRVVPGDPRNLKITTPADLDRVAHLLRG